MHQLTDEILRLIVRRSLSPLTSDGYTILPQAFIDLNHTYGAASHPSALALWRLGNNGELNIVNVPPSELKENNVLSMIAEAIQEGAWD